MNELERLLAGLNTTDEALRLETASLLGRLGYRRVVERLSIALEDRDAHIRYGAARALARLGDSGFAALTAALRAAHLWVRLAAAEALGNLGDARALDPLVAVLQDADPYARQGAMKALGRLGDDGAIEPLAMVFRSAVLLTDLIGDNPRGRSDEAMRVSATSDAHAAGWALGQLGEAGFTVLIAFLWHRSATARLTVMGLLGKLGDGRAVEPLIAALQDVEPLVGAAAAAALGELGDARAVEPLATALLQGTDLGVRAASAAALGLLGDPGLEVLIVALENENRDVRWAAANYLGQAGSERAVEPLLATLNDADAHIRKTAAQALGVLGDGGLAALNDALQHRNPMARAAAAFALDEIRNSHAVE